MSSPRSSPMMAGPEILDGSSLMPLQLRLWEEIFLSSFPSSFLKKKVIVPPALSLSSPQAHEGPWAFIKARPSLLPKPWGAHS